VIAFATRQSMPLLVCLRIPLPTHGRYRGDVQSIADGLEAASDRGSQGGLGKIPLGIREFTHRIIMPAMLVVVHAKYFAGKKLKDFLCRHVGGLAGSKMSLIIRVAWARSGGRVC
jgi:hypothetical protein